MAMTGITCRRLVLRIRIRDPVLFWSGIRSGKKNRIRDEHPRSFSREFKTVLITTVKCLNSLMRIRIRDPVYFRPWTRDGTIRIRDKHPGSATLQETRDLIYSDKPGQHGGWAVQWWRCGSRVGTGLPSGLLRPLPLHHLASPCCPSGLPPGIPSRQRE